MESKVGSIYIIAILFTIVTAQFVSDDSADEGNNDGRPLYIPGRCPKNQLLYPATDDNARTGSNVDGTCDCGLGFIYYAAKDECFEAYRRGPCNENEYLILKKPSNTAGCAKNPCKTDSLVRFKGACYTLHNTNGCPKRKGVQGLLDINATTLAISCIYGDVTELNIINASACPPGSKRIATGACRAPY